MEFFLKPIVLIVFVATLIGYPIVALGSALTGIENRSMSIVFRGFVLLLAIISAKNWSRAKRQEKDRLFWASWWFFWGTYALVLLADTSISMPGGRLSLLERALFAFGITMIPAVSLYFNQDGRFDSRVMTVSVWGGGFTILAILIFLIQFSNFSSTRNYRAETETLNPISFGHLAVSVLLLTIWQFATTKFNSLRILLAVPFLISMTALVASSSRGPVLSLAIAILVLVIGRPRVMLSVASFGLASFVTYCVYYIVKHGSYFFLMERISRGIFEDMARRILLERSFELISENFMFGSGIEPLGAYPHNLLVESYLLGGIFSGIPFTILFVTAVYRCHLIAKNHEDQFWAALLFVQYATGSMFSGSISDSACFFSTMILVVVIPDQLDRLKSQAKSIKNSGTSYPAFTSKSGFS